MAAEPHRLNPLFVSDFTSSVVSQWVFRGLTRLDDNLEVVPDLAESWRISADGSTITFRLRRGITWHDGVPFTSRDVIFTFRQLTDPALPSPHKAMFETVHDVTAPDDHTVTVHYLRPFGSALMAWTVGILPEHRFSGNRVDDPSFDDHPVGTGPYRLAAWKRGEELRFEGFAGYHEGPPRAQRLAVRIVPDGTTRLLEARKGNIDIVEVSAGHRRAGNNGPDPAGNGFRLIRAPSMRYGFLGFNLRDEGFQDRPVRQAISHAVNKKAIVDSVLDGYASPSAGPYPPQAWYGSPDAPQYRYDPEEALRILGRAGWRRNGSGRLMKGGKPFAFTIFTNFESDEHQRVAQLIQHDLGALGMDVKINLLEWQAFRHQAIDSRTFEAVLLSRAYLWDPDIYELWHSSRSQPGHWNFLSYANPAVDRLLEEGRGTTDRQKRQAIYRRVHDLIAGDQPCIFLYNVDGLFLANDRVKGITPSPLGIYQNVHRFTLSR
jgi:peptide/nickel transport system substrate-binding protein